MSRQRTYAMRLPIGRMGLLRAIVARSIEDMERRIRVLRAMGDAMDPESLDRALSLLADTQAIYADLTAAIDKACGL